MKYKKKWWILVIIIFSASFTFGEPYSEMWIASGDTFNLDGETYEAVLSMSPPSVLLRRNSEYVDVFSIGECYETDFKKLCFTKYQAMDNSEYQVNVELYDKTPTIAAQIKYDNETHYAGEDTAITFVVNITSENPPEEIYIESVISDRLNVQTRDFDVEKILAGKRLSETKTNLDGNTSYEFEIELNSNYAKDYFIGGEVVQKYKGFNETTYFKTKLVKISPHYNLSTDFPKFNQSEDYEFSYTIENQMDSSLEDFRIELFIPKDLNLITYKKVKEKDTSSILSSNNYKVFYSTQDFEKNEKGEFNFTTRHIRTEDIKIPIKIEYYYEDIKFYSDEELNFNVTVNSTNISETCDGNDFNVTFIYDDATYAQILDGNASIEDRSFFPGMDTNARVYLQSLTEEDIESAKISIYENKELKLQQNYENIEFLNKYMAGKFNETAGFEDIIFDVEVEYFCKDSQKWFLQNMTKTIKVKDVGKVILSKDFDEEVLEGEQIEIKLNVENEADTFIHDVSVAEIIPEGFVVKGTTNKTFSLEKSAEVEAYTYFLTAPKVENDTDFILKTELSFEFEGERFNYSDEKTLTVKNKNETKLEYKLSSAQKVKVFEPLKMTLELANEDKIKISNISVELPTSFDFDTEKRTLTFPALYPEQSEKFEWFILPRKQNISFDNLIVRYESEKDNTPIEINYSVNLENPKIVFPEINYRVNALETLNKTIEYEVMFENPSDATFEGSLFFFNDEIGLIIGPNENKELSFIINDSDSEKTSEEKILVGTNVEYTYLNTIYQIVPLEIKIDVEKEPIKVNISEEQKNNDSTEVNLAAEDAKKSNKALLFSILGLVLITGVGAMFFIKHKKRSVEKPTITEEEIKRAEESKIEVTHELDSESKSEIKIEKGKKAEETIEKETNEIKPTNIFSFDDYEKLKEDLDKNLSKKK